MDDVLKRLLDTETRAEAIIASAEAERSRLIEAALDTARLSEARYHEQAAARRQPVLDAAQARADQEVANLEHAHALRQRALREEAERNEAAAIRAALDLLLAPDV